MSTYVNRATSATGLAPNAVVTRTSTGPALWAGDVAVMEVLLRTENDIAGRSPNITAVAPSNPLPPTLTEVPPCVGPDNGETDATIGPPTYVNWLRRSALLTLPSAMTYTFATPGELGGLVAVSWSSAMTVKEGDSMAPNLTALAPRNPRPLTVTAVPP